MNTIPRDAFFDLNTFFNTNKSYSGFYQPSIQKNKNSANNTINMSVDIHDTEDSYQLVAELPGITRENIVVTVKDGMLTIEASNQQQANKEKGGKLLRRERRFGKFSRSFNLGQDIEQTDIKASFKDGLLNLMIPKTKEVAPKVQQIEIH